MSAERRRRLVPFTTARPRRARLAGLGVATVLLAACGGPSTVALADLAVEQDRYDGEVIEVRGTVVEFDGPDGAHHVVMQDLDANRVELVPTDEAAGHVGSTVVARGRFEFDPGRGRLLHVDTVEPAGR